MEKNSAPRLPRRALSRLIWPTSLGSVEPMSKPSSRNRWGVSACVSMIRAESWMARALGLTPASEFVPFCAVCAPASVHASRARESNLIVIAMARRVGGQVCDFTAEWKSHQAVKTKKTAVPLRLRRGMVEFSAVSAIIFCDLSGRTNLSHTRRGRQRRFRRHRSIDQGMQRFLHASLRRAIGINYGLQVQNPFKTFFDLQIELEVAVAGWMLRIGSIVFQSASRRFFATDTL